MDRWGAFLDVFGCLWLIFEESDPLAFCTGDPILHQGADFVPESDFCTQIRPPLFPMVFSNYFLKKNKDNSDVTRGAGTSPHNPHRVPRMQPIALAEVIPAQMFRNCSNVSERI